MIIGKPAIFVLLFMVINNSDLQPFAFGMQALESAGTLRTFISEEEAFLRQYLYLLQQNNNKKLIV